MNVRKLLLALCFLSVCAAAAGKDAPRSFSLSTSRTFSPGESVKIQLFARNVPELEFRIYRVNDAVKFFSALKDVHSFGEHLESPPEQVDQRTWLEHMHDWKANLWWRVRRFFRGQFTDEARDSFRERQGKLGKRSGVVAVAQFAQIPVLNESRLVARWKLETPPAVVSETEQLPLDGLSAGVYLIEATDGTYKAYTVVIVTSIALVERSINGYANAYVADRKSGAPIADATLVLWADGHQQSSAQTNSDGFADMTITRRGSTEPENAWMLARHGADWALVTPWSYTLNEGGRPSERSYIYTDRPVYRPGHTVHFKGIVRREKDDGLVLPSERTVTFKVTGPDDRLVLNRELPVNAHGTVWCDLNLEADAALGYYSVSITRANSAAPPSNEDIRPDLGQGSFYVEEYKKPEYQVTVKASATHLLQGNSVQAFIEARYFFGEPVAGAKVKYVVHTSAHYWWSEGESDDVPNEASAEKAEPDNEDTAYETTEQLEHEGRLDANGQLTVTIPTAIDGKHEDQDYRVEARVTDAANREVSGHTSLLGTYGTFRVGVEPVSYVFQSGQPVRVKVTAVDYDGKPIQTQVHLDAVLQQWGTARKEATGGVSLDAKTGSDGTALVDLPIAANGDFKVTASARTPGQRLVEGRTWVWIWNGAGEWFKPNSQIQLIADKKAYQVGDTAHLLLVTGMKDTWTTVTVEGDSLQSRRLLHSTSDSTAFDVSIKQQSQPNVVVSAVMVRNDQVMTAQKSLRAPLVERTLTVTAAPSKKTFLPGEKGSFDIFAADSHGKPVQADLGFGEVDEALYAVRPDQSGDIVNFFYPMRFVYLQPQTSFEFFFSGRAGIKSPLLARLEGELFHPRLAQVKPGSDLVVPKVRKAFPDTAYWNPSVRTGADGHARVDFTFPDALTTWRSTIRAMTDDGKAGAVVTRVVVRKNIIVRLAAPRFFRQGDEAVLRVIAHNYLEAAKDVTFALDAHGVETVNGKTQKASIPSKGEGFVEWRVRARTTGTAVLTATALTNEESDAVEITLPVVPFGVKQRTASSGVVFSGTSENQWSYSYGAGSDAGTHSLTITIAPSVAGTVFDALEYLTSYPWGCTEQTMSSFLPDLAVTKAVEKLHLKSPIDRKTLDDEVKAGLARLYGSQHDDGGWGWWPDDESRVFMTAYVVSGLGEANSAGYAIDVDANLGQPMHLAKGRSWLASAANAHPHMLPDLRAYVAYALATTGGASKETINSVWDHRGILSDEGLALLGLTLDAAGDSRAKEVANLLENKANTTEADAHWNGTYDGLMEYGADTSNETTAFALKLLTRQSRTSSLLPKAARWLAEHRDGDYWYTTKQTAMVIMGLTDYLSLSGELANESDVEVLVNGATVGRKHFGPADRLAMPWRITVSAEQPVGRGQVTIRKTGNGITYWSTEAAWYSADRNLYQQGKVALNLTRSYYLLQKRQDKPTDAITYDLMPLNGTAHVGDIVAVRLALGGSEWKYLLAEDPIPAGTEFLPNNGLYALNNKPDWWADWFTRKEFHDDRAAFFNTTFNGRREYVYLLKVVNPGKFAISPAAAGPMYQPAIQATTDPATLEVLP